MENFKNAQDAQKRFGDKKLCVITGTSSGLGRQTVKQLLKTGDWYVIGAVRDLEKMAIVASDEGFDPNSFEAMECDLASFDSVKAFVSNLHEFKKGRPLDRLVCNAAVYQPTLDYAQYSVDNIEQQTQINFFIYFLLCRLMVSSNAPSDTIIRAAQLRIHFIPLAFLCIM